MHTASISCKFQPLIEVLYLFSGRGVFTKKEFGQNEFLLPYEGELLEKEPDVDDTYIFEFTFKGKPFW